MLGEFATSGLRAPRAAVAVQRALPRRRCSSAAEGGSLLTGIGGDEALGSSRWARSDGGRSGAERPRARDLPRVALLCAPWPVRRAIIAPPRSGALPVAPSRRRPARSYGRGRRIRRREPRALGLRLRAPPDREPLAEDGPREPRSARGRRRRPSPTPSSTRVSSPRSPPRAAAVGWTDRSDAMRALFDGVAARSQLLVALEQGALRRRLLGRPTAAAFARTWDGEAADPEVVDARVLRRVWVEARAGRAHVSPDAGGVARAPTRGRD